MAIERTSITDILQLIDAFSPNNQDSQRFENSLMAEFQSGANALNNEDLQFNHNRMKNYYDKNISKMSDEEIEYYESLDDRYKNQMKKNRQFEVDLVRKDSFTEGMLDFANKYTAVTTDPNFKEFSYNTTEVIDGKMTNVMRQASAPNPENFDGGTANEQYKNEYNKFLGQRDEYINSLKNQMQVQMGDYNDYVGKLVNDYAGTGRLSQFDLGELQELDTTYAFIINSFKDNGLIDADETAVYEAALMQKSSAPIQEFIKKDTEVKSLRREQTYKNMGAYTEMLKGLKSHQNAILNLDIGRVQNFSGQQLNDEFISIEPGTQYNPGEDPLAITYGDILYSMDAIQSGSAPSNVQPDIFAYIKDTAFDNATISQLEKELQIQDSSLLKNDGASFLATSEDEYIRGLSDGTQDHRFAFSPAKPTEPRSIDDGDGGGDGVKIREPYEAPAPEKVFNLPDGKKQVYDPDFHNSSKPKTFTAKEYIGYKYSDIMGKKDIINTIFEIKDGSYKFNKDFKYDPSYGINYDRMIDDYSQNFDNQSFDLQTYLKAYASPKFKRKLERMLKKFYAKQRSDSQRNQIGKKIVEMINNEDLKF